MSQTPEQRRRNLRLGLTLLTVALVFGLGFFAKAMMFGL
ncbi:MAG: cytochrome oxidase small assembly protein [Pseudomonadota bacterium]|nr:cytochrome oxidase small assembly protein [Pseudomonadota bacterium]